MAGAERPSTAAWRAEHLNAALAAFRAGDVGAADRLVRGVLVEAPDDAGALVLAGTIAFGKRDFAAAERAFGAALAVAPQDRAARLGLGKVYEATSRWDDAIAVYEPIVRARGDDVETWIRIGIVRYVQARFSEACAAFAAVLHVRPEHPVALLNFGIVATLVGEYDDAIRVLRGGVAARADDAELWCALAEALRERGDAEEAAHAVRGALALAPAKVEALVVAGRLAYDAGDFAGAETAFAAAEAADPQRYEAPMNRAVLAHGLGDVPTALERGRHAVRLAPDEPEAHVNLGMTQLLAGEHTAGFLELEWRHRLPSGAARAAFFAAHGVPRWDGRPVPEGTLLVARDQGLGDFVLWSRLFDAVRTGGTRLAVECPAPLLPLYRDAGAIGETIAERCEPERLGTFTAYVLLGSLPAVLGIGTGSIPPGTPYLRADPGRAAAYRARFARLGKRRLIGIAWAGEPSHRLDRFRSCALGAFAALADIEEVGWVGLQVGPRAADPPPPGFELLSLAPQLTDFGETAAAIAALDLVISVDTAVAHVAGALGAPVWTLHGFGHYWLWGLERPDTPWYPTMRLFRQNIPNRWDALFADLRTALHEWLV